MRKDLMQWDHALKLAETLSKPQLPEIYVLHGEQLESRGQTQDAMTMFENALQCEDESGRQLCPEDLVRTAEMGIARCNLRMGNIGQGIRYANEMDDQQLYEDAGDLLEQQKQYHEAVKMFVKCNLLERAAFIYTKYIIVSDKSRIQEATDIMEKIHNDQINSAFAKACVGMKQYAIAARAYMRAKELIK
jgi:WD repeat-containing protein 19